MIVNTSAVLGIRCGKCGKLNYHGLSLFGFSGGQNQQLKCDCGTDILAVALVGKNRFSLRINCALCENNHIYYFSLKELWQRDLLTVLCQETGLEIAYWGRKAQVREAWQRQEKTLLALVEDIGGAGFFDNPDIMYLVLEHLNRLSESGRLDCACGNRNIDLEILPDRLQLDCNECGARGLIFAEGPRDLFFLQQLDKIRLSEEELVLRGLDKPKKTRRRLKKQPDHANATE